MRVTMDKYKFSARRCVCPECKSKRGFAGFIFDNENHKKLDGKKYGYCHSCNITIFPDGEKTQGDYVDRKIDFKPSNKPPADMKKLTELLIF